MDYNTTNRHHHLLLQSNNQAQFPSNNHNNALGRRLDLAILNLNDITNSLSEALNNIDVLVRRYNNEIQNSWVTLNNDKSITISLSREKNHASDLDDMDNNGHICEIPTDADSKFQHVQGIIHYKNRRPAHFVLVNKIMAYRGHRSVTGLSSYQTVPKNRCLAMYRL
nr:4358_t:CDS:2 [Entrophospora candida]